MCMCVSKCTEQRRAAAGDRRSPRGPAPVQQRGQRSGICDKGSIAVTPFYRMPISFRDSSGSGANAPATGIPVEHDEYFDDHADPRRGRERSRRRTACLCSRLGDGNCEDCRGYRRTDVGANNAAIIARRASGLRSAIGIELRRGRGSMLKEGVGEGCRHRCDAPARLEERHGEDVPSSSRAGRYGFEVRVRHPLDMATDCYSDWARSQSKHFCCCLGRQSWHFPSC